MVFLKPPLSVNVVFMLFQHSDIQADAGIGTESDISDSEVSYLPVLSEGTCVILCPVWRPVVRCHYSWKSVSCEEAILSIGTYAKLALLN